MQNGQLFERVILSKLVTAETDGGLLPTPIASKAVEQRVKFKQGGTPLRAAIDREMLPTPRASEWKGCGQVGSKSSLKWKKQGYLSGVINEDCSLPTGEATHLNPAFVEEMMGYPTGYLV